MDAMTTKYSGLLIVLLLFIAALFTSSVTAPSPCSGPLARQNERCRNNISFFKRMLESGRRGIDSTTIGTGDNWENTNDFEDNGKETDDYRYKLQLIWELLRDVEQYKV